MEIEDIDDLLARASKFSGNKSPGIKRAGNSDAQVILRNRPVGASIRRDNWIVQIYKPTELPTMGFPVGAFVVLHSHRCFVDKCTPNRMCHELGYQVKDSYREQFNAVWDYLYSPAVQLGSIKLEI